MTKLNAEARDREEQDRFFFLHLFALLEFQTDALKVDGDDDDDDDGSEWLDTVL